MMVVVVIGMVFMYMDVVVLMVFVFMVFMFMIFVFVVMAVARSGLVGFFLLVVMLAMNTTLSSLHPRQ